MRGILSEVNFMAFSDVIGVLWLIGLLYWIVSARGIKRIVRRESRGMRLAFLAQAVLTAILLRPGRWPGWLGDTWIIGGLTRYWIAVAVVAAGLGLSIWARRALGRNWSGTVAVKEDHELIQSGPYVWVRHPIYSGILLMILGTGLASGRAHGLLAFPIAVSALWLRSRAEERWMGEVFGERYAAYRRKSWALIPPVL
ncbi:MAG: isoprenylcysteine carboxylmethyltransferase family protein [Vicinamibacteria bacterium]